MSTLPKKPSVINQRIRINNQFITVYEDTLELNGLKQNYFWVSVGTGVSVIALNEKRQICMINVYRHAMGNYYWGLPSGGVEASETPLKAAKKELREEAGITARSWHKLGIFMPSPGSVKQVCHMFVAQALTVVETQHEAMELIRVDWKSESQIQDMIASGELFDAWALVPLLRYFKST